MLMAKRGLEVKINGVPVTNYTMDEFLSILAKKNPFRKGDYIRIENEIWKCTLSKGHSFEAMKETIDRDKDPYSSCLDHSSRITLNW